MATLFKMSGESLEVDVKDDLDTLQELIGGLVEFVHFEDGSAIMVNEEGRIRGLRVNIAASFLAAMKGRPEWVVGPAVFVSKAEMETIS